MSEEIVIVGGARTPMAEYSGTPGYGLFKDLSAIELGAIAAKAALERSRVPAKWVDHVVMGNAQQTSADAIYGARHVGLKAGVPIETPAVTVNRLCGSGIQSIVDAAHQILLGESTIVLAGGMENMSQAPHVLRGARQGWRFGQDVKVEDSLFLALRDPYCGCFMAETANNLGKKYGISREDADQFALRSHQLGAKSTAAGVFKDEIVPVAVKAGKDTKTLDHDDHVKPETTYEALAKLRLAFGEGGTVTAGNASGIVDGAACVVVTSAKTARERELPALGRLVSWAVTGVDPSIMGIGPAPAIRLALKKAGLSLEQLDLVEVNEAFSTQVLAVEKELGIPRDRLNVNGGAVSIGHPLGASGTRITLHLLLELRRRNAKLGVASACIGGGQGIAMVVERV
jgi:acetyl-CoA acetyltransferase family protein